MFKFLITLLGALPVLVIAGLIVLKKRRLDADVRREAITTDLLNPPARSLEIRRDDNIDTQLARMISAVVGGLVGSSLILTRHTQIEIADWGMMDMLIALVIATIGLYYGRLMIQDMRESRQLTQAIRAEQACAQELAASLAGNNRIIHDLHCGDFNIDHVVVTPAGVFAVETKSRLKPPTGSGAPKVKYNGQSLDFGTWSETKPVEQAERQARWLAGYLFRETGDRYAVTAVLALPGWYVERVARIGPDHVQVINPK